MTSDKSSPIKMQFKSFQADAVGTAQVITTFNSYSFERNLLVPASAFRFTAPGIDKDVRVAVRSGDLVELFVKNEKGDTLQVATGYIDETDTHVLPNMVEYGLSGRDTMGCLVDNASVDAQNRIINVKSINMEGILGELVKNTRIPAGFKVQQVPNGNLLFQTNPSETKINALQRMMEFTNCLIWADVNGQVILGKPNFTADRQGKLIISSTDSSANNLLDARVRRNVNTAIRQIVVQLQTLEQVDAGAYTVANQDDDMLNTRPGVGRSVYRQFSYGQGNDAVNQVSAIGNATGNPRTIGNELAARELAKDNMKILDVECVVRGHVNDAGVLYNIDQIYNVQIEDDDVDEDMYVYAVKYDLTLEHGMLTTLRLCRLGTIVAYADQLRRKAS